MGKREETREKLNQASPHGRLEASGKRFYVQCARCRCKLGELASRVRQCKAGCANFAQRAAVCVKLAPATMTRRTLCPAFCFLCQVAKRGASQSWESGQG